jgi:PAS domain S-box-containing protein
MKTLSLPFNEVDRLKKLHDLHILDTLSDNAFNDITLLATQIGGTSIGLITLLDETRLWVKSSRGTKLIEIPRDQTFCAHTILNPEGYLIVEDCIKDNRFSSNPYVLGAFNIHFYAGFPLVTNEGFAIGTLCLIHDTPHQLTGGQITCLSILAKQVMKLIELNKVSNELEIKNKEAIKKTRIYEQTNEVANTGWWNLDLIDGILTWSDITKIIHGVDHDYQPDLETAINFYPEGKSRTVILDSFENCILNGVEADCEVELTTTNGSFIWIRTKMRATINEGENYLLNAGIKTRLYAPQTVQVSSIYGTIQDITKQKKNLEALEKSEKLMNAIAIYYKSLIENQSFFFLKIDLAGNYTYLNPFFCKTLGIAEDEWVGKNALESIIPADQPTCSETVEKCIVEPGKGHLVILRKEGPNGIFTIQWEFIIVKNETGENGEVICIGHEITELLQKQKELQELVDLTVTQNTRLQNFTHIISHNIRSHISNMRGVIDLAEHNIEEAKDILLEVFKKSVIALDDTIQNLTDIIQIQTNLNIPKKNILLLPEINKVLELLQAGITKSDCHFDIAIPETQEINTNPAYLESILLNLLSNAVKYRSEDRQLNVDIGLEKSGNYNVLTIKDNGLGINMTQNRDKIFRMYKTFHKNKDSRGLGLFITKTQIEAMKGKIELESTQDVGSTFKVYFPDTK